VQRSYELQCSISINITFWKYDALTLQINVPQDVWRGNLILGHTCSEVIGSNQVIMSKIWYVPGCKRHYIFVGANLLAKLSLVLCAGWKAMWSELFASIMQHVFSKFHLVLSPHVGHYTQLNMQCRRQFLYLHPPLLLQSQLSTAWWSNHTSTISRPDKLLQQKFFIRILCNLHMRCLLSSMNGLPENQWTLCKQMLLWKGWQPATLSSQ
jgi:hypothetical protein